MTVEAKSRHRPGVINQPGHIEEEKLLRGDVWRLLNDALDKNPDNGPFFIFIDLNSPLTPNIEMQEKQWFKDLSQIITGFEDSSPQKPDPYNAVFFTNFSFYYQTEKEADPAEHLILFTRCPKYVLPDGHLLNMLQSSLSYYGAVPNIGVDGISF